MAKLKTTTKMQIYVPNDIADEIKRLAQNNDRSPGYVVGKVWQSVRDKQRFFNQPRR